MQRLQKKVEQQISDKSVNSQMKTLEPKFGGFRWFPLNGIVIEFSIRLEIKIDVHEGYELML